MIHSSDYFALFGAASLVLGILGFVRAKSVPSLVVGGMFGVILIISAIVAHTRGERGYIMGFIASLLLMGRFVPTFARTKKFYPNGIMAILATIGVAVGVMGWLSHR